MVKNNVTAEENDDLIHVMPKSSKISPFLIKLYTNKFKNFIQTSKFKLTFRGLQVQIKMFFLSMQVRYPTDYGYQLNDTILFFL